MKSPESFTLCFHTFEAEQCYIPTTIIPKHNPNNNIEFSFENVLFEIPISYPHIKVGHRLKALKEYAGLL